MPPERLKYHLWCGKLPTMGSGQVSATANTKIPCVTLFPSTVLGLFLNSPTFLSPS